MRLFEMGRRPEKAGIVALRFGWLEGDPDELPFRKENLIVLPNGTGVEFFPLLDGEQFLLRLEDDQDSKELWLGGTDAEQRPFLIRLAERAFGILHLEGEEGFFAALKPDKVIRVEKEFAKESIRQGDVFATPIPFSWEDIAKAYQLIDLEERRPKEVEEHWMIEADHFLQGSLLIIKLLGHDRILVDGILTAPGYEPYEMKGVHILTSAEYIFTPQKAD